MMKTRLFGFLFSAVLAVSVLAGCSAADMGQMAQSAGRSLERGMAAMGATGSEGTAASSHRAAPSLSPEEAQRIALKHAGLSTGQVTGLHTEYEVEDGVHRYDVDFHHGSWEYDYEVHADTGEILSWDKDA